VGSRADATAAPFDLKLLRVLRTLRLVRMLKVVRGSKIMRRYETRFAINYSMLSLTQCIVGMLFLSHWCANPPRRLNALCECQPAHPSHAARGDASLRATHPIALRVCAVQVCVRLGAAGEPLR